MATFVARQTRPSDRCKSKTQAKTIPKSEIYPLSLASRESLFDTWVCMNSYHQENCHEGGFLSKDTESKLLG